MTSTFKQFKARALRRPAVRQAYDELAEEFSFIDEVLKARAASGLTQAELAARGIGFEAVWRQDPVAAPHGRRGFPVTARPRRHGGRPPPKGRQ